MMKTKATHSESVASNPHHNVDTNKHIIEPSDHNTIDPCENQVLAFKLLSRHVINTTTNYNM